MKLLLLLTCLLSSNHLLACTAAEPESCVYEKHNIRFSYLERWHVAEESGWFTEPYVFLETEDSGLIMVILLPPDENKTLEVFAKEYSASANSQMIMGAFESKGFSSITAQSKHQGLAEQVTLTMFEQTVPMTRQYFAFYHDKKTAYIIIQLDDEELDDLAGLEQVLNSFEFVEKDVTKTP